MQYFMYDTWYFYAAFLFLSPSIVGAQRSIDYFYNLEIEDGQIQFQLPIFGQCLLTAWNILYLYLFYLPDDDILVFGRDFDLSVKS